MTRWVGLIRNVMIGREGLHREVLLGLLSKAGGQEARSYLATGNVTFSVDTAELPRLTDELEDAIAKIIGRREPVMTRPAEELQALVAADPFSRFDPVLWTWEVAFLSARAAPINAAVLPPLEAAEVVRVTRGELLLAARRDATHRSFAGPVLEKATKERATSRAWSTVERLARNPGP